MSEISIESFTKAIAGQLRRKFRGYKVYDDEIPQEGYENCFHIAVVTGAQKRVGKKRFRRDYDFDISFHPASDSIDDFYKWSEKMLLGFKTVKVRGSVYNTKDTEIERVDGVWHFTFAVSFFVVEVKDVDLMDDLVQKRGVANGGRETGGYKRKRKRRFNG